MAQFEKGWRGGPGRPLGSRNKSALVFDAVGLDGIEKTIRMVKEKADKHGSLRAAPKNHKVVAQVETEASTKQKP